MKSPTGTQQLIGVLLVANTNLRSDKLVFRFPPVQRNQGLTQETRHAIRGNNWQDLEWKEPPSDKSEFPLINNGASSQTAYEMPSVVLSTLLCPKSGLTDGAVFELIVDRTMFIGQPVIPKRSQTFRGARTDTTSTQDTRADVLTMYNFYLVIKRDSESNFINMIKHIVQQLAVGSLYEENRCGYMSEQIFKMLGLREEWLNKQNLPNKPDHITLTTNMLDSCSLAVTMRTIFYGITDEGKVHCKINNWVSLSLSIKSIEEYPKLPLRPYQTILLYDSVDQFLQSLPNDASPSLRLVVQVVNPKKSFIELKQETGIPLSQLYRIASHLIYWGKAKVIVFLTKLNIYTLNPNTKDHFQHLIAEFNKEYPKITLQSTLELFSTSKKLGDHIQRHHKSMHTEFVNIVIWLLRHDLLIQLHTYIYLMIQPNRRNSKSSRSERRSSIQISSATLTPPSAEHPLAPIPLTEEEEEYINQLNDNTPLFKHFKQLCPYFRGQHHLEEIMWRENISREDISKILVKYQTLLVQVDL